MLSVIIPTYNDAEKILVAVASAIQVKSVNEIIIIDDYSKDNTEELLKNVIKKNKKIKYFKNKKNIGSGLSFIKGIQKVNNKYLIKNFFRIILVLILFTIIAQSKESDKINKNEWVISLEQYFLNLGNIEGSFTQIDQIGNITFYDSSGQSDYNFSKPYSEETAQTIDKEISAIIENLLLFMLSSIFSLKFINDLFLSINSSNEFNEIVFFKLDILSAFLTIIFSRIFLAILNFF